MEANYNNWTYRVPAYTICSDYINDSFIDEYYKRIENVTLIDHGAKIYRDYRHYMPIIASLNAENITFIDRFQHTELFKNLSGEEIFDIAVNAMTVSSVCIAVLNI